ncbi:MAG: hypothetical protein IT210_24770, partial [Armatimonadetes bacterium]|nr:hypothetical protein [Armatimonadota bacterium]
MAKRCGNGDAGPQTDDLIPAPHNVLYQAHDPEDDRMTTLLSLAGEAMAAPCDEPAAESLCPRHATPEGGSAPPPDFAGLIDLAGHIRAFLDRNPELAAMTERLPEAIGSVDVLRNLFSGLLAKPPVPMVKGNNGKPLLTRREVEVLKEASRGTSHEAIGQTLGIAKQTVKEHFDHIYRKLGAHTSLQAVARAVAMGYLEMGEADLFGALAGAPIHNFGNFRTLLQYSGSEPEAMAVRGFRDIAAFGLLLLILASRTTAHLAQWHSGNPLPQGIICELSPEGKVIRSFGREHLQYPRAIAVAPLRAARHGFTPGHFYVGDRYRPEKGLNNSCISEFTPEGEFVRSFCGSPEIGSRLSLSSALAFDAEGRLLATSDGLTDAILAFSAGGAKVRRWADIGCTALCVSPDGTVYATQQSSMGSIIKVYDARGRLLKGFGEAGLGRVNYVQAVDSKGCIHTILCRDSGLHADIQVYNASGDLIHLKPIATGGAGCRIAIDEQDRLYFLTGGDAPGIRILTPDLRPVGKIGLKGKLKPFGLALGDGGKMWVCGEV